MSGNDKAKTATLLGVLTASSIALGVCIGGILFIDKKPSSLYMGEPTAVVAELNKAYIDKKSKESYCESLMSVAVEGMFNRQYTQKPSAVVGEAYAKNGEVAAYNLIVEAYKGKIVLGEKEKDDVIMDYAMGKYAECMAGPNG